MLMSLPELVNAYDMKIAGVLHVGAHLAEEAQTYSDLNVGEVWWVEGNPHVQHQLTSILSKWPGQHLVEGLVYEADGVVLDFNVTNYDGMSSSILEFGTHPEFSPDTVFVDKVSLVTSTIDSIVREHGVKANFLNMDLQGAELYALKGAVELLPSLDYVMTEINSADVYVGCARVEQLDAFLDGFGFRRAETYWVPGQGWGDGLYVRGGA